jgi:hypothetical protein
MKIARRTIIILLLLTGVGFAARITGGFSISGGASTDSFSIPTFVDFDAPGGGSGNFTFTADLSGDFVGQFVAGDPGTILDLGTSPEANIANFITATSSPGPTTVEFRLDDFSYNGDGTFILGTGTGVLKMDGFDDTPAEIALASFSFPSGFGAGSNPFFATIVAVPEPSSAALLLCGFGLVLRRRR